MELKGTNQPERFRLHTKAFRYDMGPAAAVVEKRGGRCSRGRLLWLSQVISISVLNAMQGYIFIRYSRKFDHGCRNMSFTQEFSSWLSPSKVETYSIPTTGSRAPPSDQITFPRKDGKPVVITFLRHCGCPCMKAISIVLCDKF